MKKSDIKTLRDLVEFGICAAGEDDNYLYIYEDNPERGIYDSSFFLFNKQDGSLKHIPDDLLFVDQSNKITFTEAINRSKPISDIEYIKTFA